jgi:ketosteroid isomerase-like protein
MALRVARLALVPLMLATGFAASLAAQGQRADVESKAEVLKVDAAYQEALLRADTKALAGILADDVVIVHSDGGADTKTNFLDAIFSGRLRLLTYKRTGVEVRIHGNVAFLLSQTKKVFTYKGGEGSDYDTSLVTYEKQGGRWRMVAMVSTHKAE